MKQREKTDPVIVEENINIKPSSDSDIDDGATTTINRLKIFLFFYLEISKQRSKVEILHLVHEYAYVPPLGC